MRSPIWLVLVLLLTLSACDGSMKEAATNAPAKSESTAGVDTPAREATGSNQMRRESAPEARTATAGLTDDLSQEQVQQKSLAPDSLASDEAADRKIIRNAT